MTIFAGKAVSYSYYYGSVYSYQGLLCYETNSSFKLSDW